MKQHIQKSSYAQRDNILRSLGYACYTHYLRSDLWKSIRLKVLERDKCRCRSCGSAATHVHHQRYSHNELLGRKIKQLVSLCANCHKSIEFSDKGKKKTLDQANSKLDFFRNSNCIRRAVETHRDLNKQFYQMHL